MLRQAFILILLTASAGWATLQWHPRAPALFAVEDTRVAEHEVTLAQIQERWQGDVLWLDARPRDQYEAAHVPGAERLSAQDFDNDLFNLLDKLQTNTKPVVVYCSGERCAASQEVREKLLQAFSIENCFVLKGGWKTWVESRDKGKAP